MVRVICARDMPWPQNYKRYKTKGFRQHVGEVRNSGFVAVIAGMWHTPPSQIPNTNKMLVEQEDFDFFGHSLVFCFSISPTTRRKAVLKLSL